MERPADAARESVRILLPVRRVPHHRVARRLGLDGDEPGAAMSSARSDRYAREMAAAEAESRELRRSKREAYAAKARELYAKGLTLSDIARRLTVSPSTVARMLGRRS